jgi:hypothetical protein
MAEYGAYKSSNTNDFFATMSDDDEKLHPVPAHAGFEWTETNMFGFNIPEHNIDCLIYLWHRPVLKVTYGGVTVWQGFKKTHLEAEAFDFRSVMPMPEEPTDATYPMGLTVKMIQPQKEFYLTWKHPIEDSRFELHLTAVMPPAVRHTGNHLAQVMRTRGTLVLQGKTYVIDGLHTRDRSWGEHRTEAPRDLPPISWIVATFGEDFAIHFCGFESPERHPEWREFYPSIRPGDNTLWGYVRENGKTLGVRSGDLFVHRTSDGLTPERIELALYAENGRTYSIEGTVTALVPQPGWPNMTFFMGLTEWRCSGRVGYGDIQDVNYGAHMRRFRVRPAAR